MKCICGFCVASTTMFNYFIREWRKANGLQPGALSSSKPVHESMPSPTVSASRKKQKASQSVASLPVTAPSPGLLPSMQPSSSSLKQGLPQGGRTKKTKSVSIVHLLQFMMHGTFPPCTNMYSRLLMQ